MSRNTTSVSSSRSLFENLEGRSLRSATPLTNCDFNHDGVTSSDDHVALDAIGAAPALHDYLDGVIGMLDKSGDGMVSGDDLVTIDSNPDAYTQDDKDTLELYVNTQSGATTGPVSVQVLLSDLDKNNDGEFNIQDLLALDASGNASAADYAKVEKALKVLPVLDNDGDHSLNSDELSILRVDFNADGQITEDDYSGIDATVVSQSEIDAASARLAAFLTILE